MVDAGSWFNYESALGDLAARCFIGPFEKRCGDHSAGEGEATD
jgi:hypothetical protein